MKIVINLSKDVENREQAQRILDNVMDWIEHDFEGMVESGEVVE